MENLAPAGNREALERAEAAGADAVYLGYAAFSARAGAGNFDREALRDAIRFAHLRHMRVHVTVNTLIKDAELEEVTKVLCLLRELGADAVLVQDLGVLRIARAVCPGLTIHASTQMAIHNRTGVLWCRRMGIRRVVLARECSLQEIRLCGDTGVEIEVFVHGAQCVSVSGLCLFSSMVGERSGNRGRCAQPCRLEYLWRGRRGAWLSPRDLCLRDHLPELADAGVASVKIEGRLKRPEYVAVVTESYRGGLDAAGRGAFAPAGEDEKEGLLQVFNRGGFMDGYALGCEDAAVICPEQVNHRGLLMGRLTGADGKLARLNPERPLHNGDGLVLRGRRGEEPLTYSGPEVPPGGQAVLRLRPGIRAEAGDEVYRLTDVKQTEAALSLKGRKVKADLTLRAFPGKPLTLTASDGESKVTVTGETVAPARTREAEPLELARLLERTGETVFVPGKTRVETAGAFVPVSAVNALRREALEKLAEARTEAFAPRREAEPLTAPPVIPGEKEAAVPLACVRTRSQAKAARAAGFRVAFAPEDYRKEALEGLLAEMEKGDWFRLPDVCEEQTLLFLRDFAGEHRDFLGGVVLGTVGQLGLEWPVPFGAGSGIPVMNRQAASLLLEEGCSFVTASPELSAPELEQLLSENQPILVPVYGRTRLMLLHHCPARTALGLKTGHAGCTMCDTGHPDALAGGTLEDRRGYRFPLLRQRLPEGCLVELMNALPTRYPAGKGFIPMADLTLETPEEAEAVFASLRDGSTVPCRTTSGHWKRPVE